MRDPRERLRDMLEAIEHIERYAPRGRDTFERDELIQNWIVRRLQIIDEAARAMPQEVRERATHIPWSNSRKRESPYASCPPPPPRGQAPAGHPGA
jgi:uncharacterized protein with HEPN domain